MTPKTHSTQREQESMLFVTDVPGIGNAFKGLLQQRLGIRVDTANSSKEALTALRGENGYRGISAYRLVLVDRVFESDHGQIIFQEAIDKAYQGAIKYISKDDLSPAHAIAEKVRMYLHSKRN